VIKARSRPPGFGDAFPAEQVDGWWEDWMRQVDQVLDDEDLVAMAYEALVRRHPKSRTRGRWGTPAEIVLRMLVLKHVCNCSFEDLEHAVRANLVYRQFTRIGAGKVPDAKALGRQSQALGPEVLQMIHGRVVQIARQNRIATGRKLRVDTTVVETNIHYPTDSSLLNDGVRVLTRVMKRVTDIAGEVGAKLRDRSRSVRLRVLEIARASRSKSEQGQQRMKDLYGKVLDASGRVARQAQQFVHEIASGVKRSADFKKQAALEGMKKELETMLGRVKQVRRQTRARVFGGNTHVDGKLVSVFEPNTEIIRRGKAKQPTEFGKMIQVQEAEGQIIVGYEVFQKRPADSDLLVPAIEIHQQRLGRVPDLVAADAAFYSAGGEKAAHQLGVKYVSVPNRSTKSKERKTLQRTRWFKKGQKWRTGCEGRISVLKRRHGLTRCRYRGDSGMARWVGLGVISDALINVGRTLAVKTDAT
jgi:transposase, IS5 family